MKTNCPNSELKVFEETNNSVQPWHILPFTDFANNGVEISYTGQDTTIDNVVSPFVAVSDRLFSWNCGQVFRVPVGKNLLILPHHRFYFEDNYPCPIPQSFQHWWVKPIEILFKKQKSIFINNQPIAQAIMIDQMKVHGEPLSDSDNQRVNKLLGKFERKTTRNWITNSGYIQDNLYNILYHNKDFLPKRVIL